MKFRSDTGDIACCCVNQKRANYARNWDKLGEALGVTRRAIQEWRKDQRYAEHCPKPRSDGRHDINAWKVFMLRFGLKRADEVVDRDEIPEERRAIHQWKEHREKLLCTQLERSILRDDRILLVATEIEIALGQLLVGISVALDHFPPSAARFIVGLRDIHDVQAKLQSEIDAVKKRINAARYLDECDEAAKPYLQRIGRALLAEITRFS
jgi:hypothetical protein